MKTRAIPMTRYLIWMLAFAFSGLGAYAGLCLALDPYRVFSSGGLVSRNFEANNRAVKARQIAEGCTEYRIFAFGNSRSGRFDDERLARLGGGRGFNYGVAAETLGGMLRRAEWVATHCPGSRVVAFIDIQMFQQPDVFTGDLLRREPDSISGDTRLGFLWPYFFLPARTIARGLDRMTRPARVGGPVRKSIPVQCHAPKPWNERVHAENLARFHRLVDLLRSRFRDPVIVVLPLNQNLMASFDGDVVSRWARDVVSAADGVWFFAGMNALAVDDSRFIDIGHFDGRTADDIVDIILGLVPGGDLMGRYERSDAEHVAELVARAGRARAASCGPASRAR